MAEPADPKTAPDSDLAEAQTVVLRAASPAALRDAPEPGVQVDRYRLAEPLGEGGMGVVYAAYDPDLDRNIALKFLHKTELPTSGQLRLLREAQAMAQLAHPNVATVFDVGTHDSRVFIAMELVDGSTMKDWLKEERTWQQTWRVFRQAALGLTAAHDAGIVHRDFKPSNVLLDRKGRARVTDFGIARALQDEDTEQPSTKTPSTALNEALTVTGAVVGTPGYMAPEQYAGTAVDARTDQFAFCIALYEALYGERPFEGRTVPELALTVSDGDVLAAKAGTSVPAWRRKVLLRGLSPKPRDRYPSMNALVEALDFDPVARRNRWIAGGVVMAAFAGVIAFAVVQRGGAKQPEAATCVVDRSLLGDAWSDVRKAKVRSAILATKLSYAKEVWNKFDAAVNGYEQRWLDRRLDACEATHVRKEQSEAVLDLRMQCLAERRGRLDALTDVLSAKIKAKEMRALVVLVSKLPQPSGCDDIKNLQARAPLPEGEAARKRIEDVSAKVDRATAEAQAGRLPAAKKRLAALGNALAETNYPPLESRAAFVQAVVLRGLNEFKAAEKVLRTNIAKAARSGDHSIQARMWMELATGLIEMDRRKEAELAHQAAEAALIRAGSPPALTASYNDSRGLHAIRASDLKAALKLWTKASALWLKARGPDSVQYGRSLTRLGVIQSWSGQKGKSLPNAQKGLAILKKAFGSVHPDVMKGYRAVGEALLQSGKNEQSRDHLLRAVAIGEKLFGPNHPQVGLDLVKLGTVYTNLAQFDEAMKHLKRSIKINMAVGKNDRNTVYARSQLSITLRAAGRYAEAETQMRACIKGALVLNKNPNDPETEYLRLYLGLSLVEQGKWNEADKACRFTAKVLRKRLAEVLSRMCVGRAQLGKGNVDRAISQFEAAIKLGAEKDVSHGHQAAARYWLGIALSKEKRAPERVRKLMAEGKAMFDAKGQKHSVTYKRITDWLNKNGK